MNTAFMLRNDGKAIPVRVHLYTMQDDDFSSEAEVASFMLTYAKQDHDIAEYTIDAWMASSIIDRVSYDSTIENIDSLIRDLVTHYMKLFPFPLTMDRYMSIHDKLGNFNDFDTLMDFYDRIQAEKQSIWDNQQHSLNQQFIRSRFGGTYDTSTGNREMWFRIGSIGFNWIDVIYIWTINNKDRYNIQSISVCRDHESDFGFGGSGESKFYKAKDGTVYHGMPIDEFLNAEHESNLVFSSTYNIGIGVIASIRNGLRQGDTLHTACIAIGHQPDRIWERIQAQERRTLAVVDIDLSRGGV